MEDGNRVECLVKAGGVCAAPLGREKECRLISNGCVSTEWLRAEANRSSQSGASASYHD